VSPGQQWFSSCFFMLLFLPDPPFRDEDDVGVCKVWLYCTPNLIPLNARHWTLSYQKLFFSTLKTISLKWDKRTPMELPWRDSILFWVSRGTGLFFSERRLVGLQESFNTLLSFYLD
jgi:hypothetical protein